MDLRRRMGSNDIEVTAVGSPDSIGTRSMIDAYDEPLIIDPDAPVTKTESSFFRSPPNYFVVKEWYGDVEHRLIHRCTNHLTYLVSSEEVHYVVYVFNQPCQLANGLRHDMKHPYTFTVISTGPLSRTEMGREQRLDWTVNSFRCMGIKPYDKLR